MNLVLVIFVNSSNKLQNLVTFASSKGESTSSRTHIVDGLVRNTAKIKDKEVIKILIHLGFKVSKKKSELELTIPTWRPDINQAVEFRFLKEELKNINLVPEVGDLILFRNNFFEVDGKVENQLVLGKDPDYALSTETVDFGGNFSITLGTHISRVEKLSLVPLRGGKYPTTTKSSGGEANEILT